jgi:putative endonuclease
MYRGYPIPPIYGTVARCRSDTPGARPGRAGRGVFPGSEFQEKRILTFCQSSPANSACFAKKALHGKGRSDSFSCVARKPKTGILKGFVMKTYYVYMLASQKNGTIYIGVTNNLERRLYEHKNHLVKGFTAKYNVTKLVWFEQTSSVEAAIEKEKQLKKWERAWKIRLIEEGNPDWRDLGEDWVVTEERGRGFPPARE